MPRRPPRAPGTLQATVGEKTKKPNHIVIDISISIVIIICSGIRMCFVSPPPRTQTLWYPDPVPVPVWVLPPYLLYFPLQLPLLCITRVSLDL